MATDVMYDVHLSPYCCEPVIEWTASGKLTTEGVVTQQLLLDRWVEAFELADKDDNSLKIILIP